MNDRGASIGAVRRKAQTAKTLRDAMVVLAAKANLPIGAGFAAVQLHYRPRDNRRRDTDNLIATAKPLYDGLVDYGLVPDDIPRWMAKPEPIIHDAVTGQPSAMWLDITGTEGIS
ncbi:hypothetical protein [Rhodococcus jostii]|uniref:hypothetical protein n=1 Tax=Rhodococcus jostii TaxID=132919 RepID=UPI0036376C5C